MTIRWTPWARKDLERLYAFLEPVNPRRAAAIVKALVSGAERLAELHRMGQRLSRYERREVRRVFIGDYELRYELKPAAVIVLRIWHTKEDR